MAKQKKRKFINIIFSIILIISSLIGLYLAIATNSFMANHIMLFFTIQSNILILLITIWYLLFKKHGHFFNLLYLASTIAISVTGIVFYAVLLPDFVRSGRMMDAFSISNITLHMITPIVAILNFILNNKMNLKAKDSLCGILPELIYFVAFIIFDLVYTGEKLFMGSNGVPTNFPYFFLDYHQNGIFTLGKSFFEIGLFWWSFIMTITVLILANVYIYLNNKQK